MKIQNKQEMHPPSDLIEAIRSFPVEREVSHCGGTHHVSPFAVYAECPVGGTRIKLRSFSGGCEIEDVFDAVFEWMNQVGTQNHVERRRKEIAQDE